MARNQVRNSRTMPPIRPTSPPAVDEGRPVSPGNPSSVALARRFGQQGSKMRRRRSK